MDIRYRLACTVTIMAVLAAGQGSGDNGSSRGGSSGKEPQKLSFARENLY